jgi:galactose-1-phosphate uridylyltransferase
MSIMYRKYLLEQNDFTNGVTLHRDYLVQRSTSISRARRDKFKTENQEPYKDDSDWEKTCRLCNPELLQGSPTLEFLCNKKIALFPNSAHYTSYDQSVLYLWNDDPLVRKKNLHVAQLGKLGKEELYFIARAVVERSNQFVSSPINNSDLPRPMFGFNLGRLAGQSIPHIHGQYGWFSTPGNSGVTIRKSQLELLFEEYDHEQLILHDDKKVKVIVPWTPKGQYEVDLFFNKNEIRNLDEDECKIFAYLGHKLLQYYNSSLGIENCNIVFEGSPLQRNTLPVMVRFIPRKNLHAQFELKLDGADVIDTHPYDIATVMRVIKWAEAVKEAYKYDPIISYNSRTEKA